MSNWEGLDEFVAVAECGRFAAAAQRLGLSTSQVSRQVARLEERLQTRLFYRSTRKVTLTEAGQTFLQHCQRLQDAREEALRAIGDLAGEPKGLLRMTCAVAYGERFVVPLVNSFMERHPQLRVEIELNNQSLDLLQGGFDLAIRSGVEQDERLVARPLFALQEITCAAPAYLARHPAPQTPAELSRHQCLLNTHYSGFEQWLYHRQHRLERVPVSGQLASNHYSLLKKAALSGAGIARLPSYMVQDELADGRLQWLLRDYQTRSTPVFLVHPWQGALPRRTQALADYLLGWFERSRRALDGLSA